MHTGSWAATRPLGSPLAEAEDSGSSFPWVLLPLEPTALILPSPRPALNLPAHPICASVPADTPHGEAGHCAKGRAGGGCVGQGAGRQLQRAVGPALSPSLTRVPSHSLPSPPASHADSNVGASPRAAGLLCPAGRCQPRQIHGREQQALVSSVCSSRNPRTEAGFAVPALS